MADDSRYGDVAATFSLTTNRFNDGSEGGSLQIEGWPEDTGSVGTGPDEDDVLSTRWSIVR